MTSCSRGHFAARKPFLFVRISFVIMNIEYEKNQKMFRVQHTFYNENSTGYVRDCYKYIIALSGSWSQSENGLKDQ
jgi:hypothetical protein